MRRKSPKKYCERISYKWRIWNWITHSLPTTKHILWLSVTLTYSKERCCFQKETLSHTRRGRIKMELTQEGRDRCILIAYSCCCTAEINTTCKTVTFQITINVKNAINTRLEDTEVKLKIQRLWPTAISSVAQMCQTFCDPMDYSTPGFPVHHQFPEVAQTHGHRVSDAIQSSHPLSSPSPVFDLSHHQGLFQRVSSSHQVAKILAFQLQHHSFQWIFRTDFL